jgi:GTPase SAR1 family protein
MSWGILLLGPPGSGKSTLCSSLLDVLRAMGRPTTAINLDPANESPGYEAGVSLGELITVGDAMEAYGLGPNGALLYCMEFLCSNVEWLEGRVAPLVEAGEFLVIDCPGQAELYTTHEGLSSLLTPLIRSLDLRLVALHLVDAHHCADPAKFIAGALLALQAMTRLELPHLNVLSKADQEQHFEGASEFLAGARRPNPCVRP